MDYVAIILKKIRLVLIGILFLIPASDLLATNTVGLTSSAYEYNLAANSIASTNRSTTESSVLYPSLAEQANVIAISDKSRVSITSAIWLFGTALIGFIGLSRRTRV